MKTIGMIGGMSWESSAEYYRLINERVKAALGGLHSAKCILYSVDFEEIERYQKNDEWDKAGQCLADAAVSLQKAGADFIVICTNTMHKVVSEIESKVEIPVLHIAEATASELKKAGIKKVGLLGTRYTMEQDFYLSKIEADDIQVLVPSKDRRDKINEVIFSELCLGQLKEESREYFKQTIKQLENEGAEGIILGCTEIGLLIKPQDSLLPVFDTTLIHAEKAAELSLER